MAKEKTEAEKEVLRAFRNVGGRLAVEGGRLAVEVGPIEYPSKRPPFAPHNEDGEEVEEEFTEYVKVLSPDKPDKRKKGDAEAPIENEEPVPLFPNLDANAKHVIAYIRVTKATPPGDGIKGDMPTSTTLEMVGRRWGDGMYLFEGLSGNHQVLRRQPNVKIAMGFMPAEQGIPPLHLRQSPMPTNSDMADKLLERQAVQHERDAERSQKTASESVSTAKELAHTYAQMIREDSQSRVERDREFYGASANQTNNFFQTLLVSMQTMHAQTMESQRESFAQTIQIMQISHERAIRASDPSLLLNMFERGMRLGTDAASGEPADPVTAVLNAGLGGLREMKEMMQLHKGAQPATLPSNASKPASTVANPRGAGKQPILSHDELIRVAKVKRMARRKGYDFDGLIQQAQTMLEHAPDESSAGNVTQESGPGPSDSGDSESAEESSE